MHAQKEVSTISNEFNTYFAESSNELWIASGSIGLNKFRGVDTKHYILNDSISGLQGSFVQSALIEDSNGLLWTTTYEYLCYYDPPKDVFTCNKVHYKDDTLSQGYRIIGYDSISNSLLLLVEEQLFKFSIKDKVIFDRIGSSKGNFFSSKNDTIAAAPWLNASGFELWTIKNDEWVKDYFPFTNCDILKDLQVARVFLIRGKTLLATNIGLVEVDFQDLCASRIFQFSKDLTKNSLTSGAVYGNRIYLTTDRDGLQVFNTDNESFKSFSSITEKRLDDVFIMSSEEIWLSNFEKGVRAYPKSKFIDLKYQLESGRMWSEIVAQDDFLLLIQKEEKVIIKDKISNDALEISIEKMPISRIVAVELIDSSKVLVCGLFNCFIFDINENEFHAKEFENVKQISDFKVKDDTLFVAADNSLFIFDKISSTLLALDLESKVDEKLHLLGNLDNITKSFGIESTKLLILSKGQEGIVEIGSFINKTFFDERSKFHYVSTNQGLFSVSSDYHVENLSVGNEFVENSTFYDIQQDSFWVYFNTKDRLGRVNKETTEFEFYTKHTFTQKPAFAVDGKELYIATDHLIETTTKEAFKNDRKFDLILDYFNVNGEKQTGDLTNIKLSHDENSIVCMAYVNNWFNSELAKVRYKISPIMSDFKVIENGKEIQFPLLLPNKYEFSMQGIMPSGEYTQIQKYNFTVFPPWYKTWWFLGLTAISGMFLLFLFYRNRIRTIEEKHKVQMEINQLQKSALQAQMNPHFIFNCLNSIQRFIMTNDKEMAMEYLSKFAKLIRQYLNASINESISIGEEISMLESYCDLETLRMNNRFDYNISYVGTEALLCKEIPPMLIQPFVENAIIHGMGGLKHQKGQIFVKFLKSDDKVLITVEDNGQGIRKQVKRSKHQSLGMSITKNRLEHIKSSSNESYELSIDSSENGTRVKIKVPL